jgi:hypothetical protein
MSQTNSELIVAQNGGRELGVAEVAQNAALLDGDFGGCKEAPIFGLLYRGTNDGNAVGAAKNGGVDEGGHVVPAEVVK